MEYEPADEDDEADEALPEFACAEEDADELDEEEAPEVEGPTVAMGHEGKELKKKLLPLAAFHQEPEPMPRRLRARKSSSDEMVGKAVAVDAESAKRATVI